MYVWLSIPQFLHTVPQFLAVKIIKFRHKIGFSDVPRHLEVTTFSESGSWCGCCCRQSSKSKWNLECPAFQTLPSFQSGRIITPSIKMKFHRRIRRYWSVRLAEPEGQTHRRALWRWAEVFTADYYVLQTCQNKAGKRWSQSWWKMQWVELKQISIPDEKRQSMTGFWYEWQR